MPDRPPPSATAPTFCPGCRRAGPAEASLCPHCGDALIVQGYCGVCEGYWRLAPGESCPKHDIAAGAVRPRSPGRRGLTGWASVATFAHPLSAEAPRIRLEAEGIPTFLDGRHVGGHGMYEVAAGGVKLQVPRHLAAEARVLLRRPGGTNRKPTTTWTTPGTTSPPPGRGAGPS